MMKKGLLNLLGSLVVIIMGVAFIVTKEADDGLAIHVRGTVAVVAGVLLCICGLVLLWDAIRTMKRG